MNELITNLLFGITAAIYLAASVLFLRFLARGKGDVGKLGPRLILLGATFHGGYIVQASLLLKVCPVEGIHFPMSVGSMLMCIAYVVSAKRLRVEVAGAFVAPLALTSLMASRFVGRGAEPGEGVKSFILPFHVTLNLFGVALFGLAFSAAALYLVQERLVKAKRIDGVSRRLPPLDALDRAEHRFLLAGFPLLTIGIITGTVWAARVESGATSEILRAVFGYVTWLVIAGVLFLRAAAGWRGRRAAYGTIAGFGFAVLVLIVYLTRKEVPHSVAGTDTVAPVPVRTVNPLSLPVVVIGVSHKTAPVDVRERFAAGAEILPELLARLTARPELEEAMFLSTCNRVEIIGLSKPGKSLEDAVRAASRAIREALREHIGASSIDDLSDWLYEKSGDDAVRHVFRVAASLDSMVLGEPQILGQVKDAYDAAVAAGALRSHLARCVHRAFTVAKHVRSETQLGAGIVSISSVAVDLAKRIFGDLGRSTVLLVGAGEMAEQAAKSLGKSSKSIRVCNRSFERAATLAATFGGTAAPLNQLEAELVISDVVVASTSSKTFVITRDLVKRVMKQRKGKTLFLIDIAVPRNVEPDVHKLDNVYVYNVDDLEQEVAENMKARQTEVSAAEAIVDAELAEWAAWARGLNVNPTVVALRAKTRGVLVAELERSLGSRLKHLTEGDRAALAQMVESATGEAAPRADEAAFKLAASSNQGSDAGDLVEALHHLFDLPKAPEADDEHNRDSRTMKSSESEAPLAADQPSEKRLPH